MGLSLAPAPSSAARGLSSHPVDEPDLAMLLRLGAGRLPTGSESPWGIVVVRADEGRHALTDLVRHGAREVAALRRPCPPGGDAALHDDWCRAHAEAEVAAMLHAPVWLCSYLGPRAGAGVPRGAHSLALAMETVALVAGAMGMRTITTIRHLRHEAAVRMLLGLPPGVSPDVAVALGYPVGCGAALKPRQAGAPARRPPVFAECFGGPGLVG